MVTSLKVRFGNLISDVARWVGLSVGICDKRGLAQPLNSTGCVHVYVCMRAWKGENAHYSRYECTAASLTHWTAQVWTANSFMSVLRERLNTRIDPLVLPTASKGV